LNRLLILFFAIITCGDLFAQKPAPFSNEDPLLISYNNAIRNNDFVLVLSISEEMIKRTPQNAEIYFRRGRIYEHLFRVGVASAHSSPKKTDSTSISYEINSQRNRDSARINYTRAIILNDSNAEYYFTRGMFFYDQLGEDNFKLASYDFIETIHLDSFYYPAYKNLSTYYYFHDAPKGSKYRVLAKRQMERAVKKDSLNGEYWYWLGQANFDCKVNSKIKIGKDEELNCYNKAITLGYNTADCFFQRGLIYYFSKEYASCIDDMRKAIQISDWIVYREYIINCYEAMGENDKAMNEIDQAIFLNPNFELLQKMKADLAKKMKGN
jgi:tetratricopeptide (TPR) repeat protein